jgi:hypothetical protein
VKKWAARTDAMPDDVVMSHVPSATRRAPSGARAMRLYDVGELGDIVYEARGGGEAELAVIIPLYNYAGSILEALDSVVEQDLSAFSLVVIDDCSTDEGGEETVRFLEQHASRFTESRLVRHHRNQGLSMARNSGIAWSAEPYLTTG